LINRSKIEEVIKYIPNFLTLCNLACGCYGVVAVFKGDLQTGSIMIWAGALFDFFDGFVARMLKKFSSIGKDLDSLADLITFCFLPASILFVIIDQQSTINWLPYFGYLLVLFGAVRLAKFNNDTRQSENFYGLPVPANGIFVSAVPFISTIENAGFRDVLTDYRTLVGISILLSIMMVSNIKLMSFKFKEASFKANWPRFLLILISLSLIVVFKIVALPFIIIIYVVSSIALNIAE
jgi:CDP-diacylglycerol--serine O-phosphatidyltransferase